MSQRRKGRFLLLMPAIMLPFLCAIFFTLGGGRGEAKERKAVAWGLNKALPESFATVRKALVDKPGAYEQADRDSMRKREFARQDPYRSRLGQGVRKDSVGRSWARLAGAVRDSVRGDEMAEGLLAKLYRLRTRLQRPEERIGQEVRMGQGKTDVPSFVGEQVPPGTTVMRGLHLTDTVADDPQLERLNKMLDKVIRIQHPGEGKPVADRGEMKSADQLVPADPTANAIPAVVPENETLINGASLPLRLTDSVRLHGTVIAAGTWVYGTVSFHNDRMGVQIRSLRLGNNIYPVDLQVYDLDGMPGIHIPVRLSQEVVKESADESVAGFNALTTDGSWQGQAANAGVQAGRSLFSRRVRQVRVSVRAGYVVLLRGGSLGGVAASVKASLGFGREDSLGRVRPAPPEGLGESRVVERCRTEGLELGLRGAYLQDSLLWLALDWLNRSSIGYTPSYYRWIVRDKHHFRRMAQQDLVLDPLVAPGLKPVPGDSTMGQWVAFRVFAPARDKELVLQVGEKDGGRSLELVIPSKVLLNAKTVQHEKDQETSR